MDWYAVVCSGRLEDAPDVAGSRDGPRLEEVEDALRRQIRRGDSAGSRKVDSRTTIKPNWSLPPPVLL